MQRFFFDNEQIIDNKFSVGGEKFNHIIRSLRMSVGETAVFCDGEFDCECTLLSLDSSCAFFKITDRYINNTEPKLKITVFQCLTKGDKMDDMVKRCVQFGVHKIIPVLSRRCVSRPDGKAASKKTERLNKIARSSAMQSMRGYIPQVAELVDFETALKQMSGFEHRFICYENEHGRLPEIPPPGAGEIAFLIGPEGGLDDAEVLLASKIGIECVSLGRRILRTEDAAAFLIPILLFNTDNL